MVGGPAGPEDAIVAQEDISSEALSHVLGSFPYAISKEPWFGVGVALGVLLGFAAGSWVAWRIGPDGLTAMARLLGRVLGKEPEVKFEALLQ